MSYINVLTNQQIYPSPNSYVLIDDVTAISADLVYLDWPASQTVGYQNHFPLSLRIDVNINTEPLVIVLPDATQGSVGQPVYINNIGTKPVSVVGNDGTTIMGSVTSGHCYWFTLTDQSTPTGVWTYVDVAAGTSTPDAAALAGYGLTTLTSNTKLNTNDQIVFLSNDTVLNSTYRGKLIIWTGGVGTITLPNPSTTDIGNGFYFMLNNESDIGGYVNVVNPYGYIDQVESGSPVSLQIGSSGQFVSDGVLDYYTFGLGFPTFYTFAVLNLNVTGQFDVGGNLILTAQQASRQIINLTGVITQNSTIIFPANPAQYYIQSLVTSSGGSYSLSIEMSDGTEALLLPYENRVIVICDGINLYYYPSFSENAKSIKFILQQPSDLLPAAQSLDELDTGMLKSTTDTGVLSIGINGTDYYGPGTPNIFLDYADAPASEAGGAFISANSVGVSFNSPNYTIDMYNIPSSGNFIYTGGGNLDFNSGVNNTIFSPSSGTTLTSASFNTIFGEAGANLTEGDGNVLIGFGAGASITKGDNNYLMGYNAGNSIEEGENNICFGTTSGNSLFPGASNFILIGASAGESTISSVPSIVIGNNSLTFNETGYKLIVLGNDSEAANDTNDLQNVTIIGNSLTVVEDNIFAIPSAQRLILGADNPTSGIVSLQGESLELQQNGSSGIYFAPSADTDHNVSPDGGTLSVGNPFVENQALTFTNGFSRYNVDLYPQTYYNVQMDYGSFDSKYTILQSNPSQTGFFPFTVISSNLAYILKNGLPTGYYSDAVVCVEQTICIEIDDIAPIQIQAFLYKYDGTTYTTIDNYPAPQVYQTYFFSGSNATAFNIKVTALIDDIVDAASTQWGIALTNLYTGSTNHIIRIVGAENVGKAYVITGGVN